MNTTKEETTKVIVYDYDSNNTMGLIEMSASTYDRYHNGKDILARAGKWMTAEDISRLGIDSYTKIWMMNVGS